MKSLNMQSRCGFAARLSLLMLLAALLFLAGNNRVGLFDRDEPWYAEISREMVRSGDWVVPRYMDAVFLGKPVLSFWCSAASISAFGDSTFAVRLPSALATLFTMLLLALVLAKYVGRRRAIWAALILATTVLTIVLSKMCLTDAILLPCVTIAQLALYAIYRGRGGWKAVCLLWLAVGCAILDKGPVVVGIQAATAVALLVFDVGDQWRSPRSWLHAARWWPRTKPWFGIFIASAVVLPWAIRVEHNEPGFLVHTWVLNMFGPIVKASLEGHGAPPGYYFLLIWPMFLPWSLFLPLAILKGWSNRRLPPIRFALAAVIGPWLLIELVKQKLPHYLFPLFPALAFLTADALVRSIRGQAHYFRPQLRGGVACWAIVVAIAGFVPFIGAKWSNLSCALPWTSMWILAIGMLCYAAVVAVLFLRKDLAHAAATMGAGMAIAAIFLYTAIVPHLDFLRLSPRCADLLIANGATAPGSEIATLIDKPPGGHEIGYKEPSLTYYLGGNLQVRNSSLLQQSSNHWPRWIILTDEIWRSCSADTQSHLQPVATISGLNYGGGGRTTHVIIAKTRPNTQTAAIDSGR